MKIAEILKENNYTFDNAELEMHADTKIESRQVMMLESFVKFLDALEELDDVQNVYTNAEYEHE